jgi:hypothetical protein
MDNRLKVILIATAFMAFTAIIATVLAELHPWYKNDWRNATNITIEDSVSNPFVPNHRLML